MNPLITLSLLLSKRKNTFNKNLINSLLDQSAHRGVVWWRVLKITSVLLLHLCFFGFQCGEDLLQHLASGEHFVANRDVCDVSGLWDRIEGSIVRSFSPRLTLPREELKMVG